MKLRWFLLGVLSVLVVGAFVGGELIRTARGFSTLEEPTAAEKWAARLARGAALPADAKSQANPVAKTPEAIAEASAHWADHCASCHSNDGSGDTVLGKHMYPPAPDMRKPDTQNLTDGELFYIIQNGIRLTGMPGWGAAHEEDSWKLVHFIRHLPELTAEEKAAMQKLNPKSPDELREEEEERKFLEGDNGDETIHEHHHH